MKMNPVRILVLCAASALANRLFPADEITVNLNAPRQTIDGVGYNHEGDRQNGDTYVIDSNIQQMLDEGITLFRDMFPNKTWEPSRGSFGYNDQRVINCFQRLKTMQDRGVTRILGIWDLPNWLITSATQGNGGGRRIANVNDVADFITSFLVRGKQVYGLDIDYVDFNETAESGVNIYLTAAEYSSIISACDSRFTANGLVTKFSQGSTLLWDRAYNTTIYNSTRTLAHSGLPGWHTYRGGSLSGTSREPLQLWKDWGTWALTLDRHLWATETDYDAFLYDKPERLTWAGSQETAVMYWRTLYVARCSTMAGWYWHSDWSSYPIHTSYINHFKPGGQILDTRRAGDLQPNDYAEDQVFALAYRHVAQNKFVLQALNQSTSDRPTNFHGLPANTTLTLIRTANGGESRHTVGPYTTDGSGNLSVTLLKQSFNTFVGALGSNASDPVVHVTSPANGAVYSQPATVNLSATASSPNGINRVEFYDGATLIGSVATSPYNYTWTNITDGNHVITAGAFDNGNPQRDGFSDNSASIQIGSSPVNRALSRPVTVSSSESASYPGSNAVDGNATTRWSSAYSDNQYIQVDLGSTFNVNEVKLSWEAAYASHFQIQTSLDNSTWTTVEDINGNTQTTNDYTGLTASARYVRINCLTRATQWGFSLFELAVYGSPVSTSYTIAASAGANGSISPTGSVAVLQGTNQTFAITPNSGYAVSSVLVDGASVGAVSAYTFSNVQAGHTISATFAAVGSGPNIAYNRPVWTSSVQGTGYEGSKAVDANGNTRWASASSDNQTIYVDLGANYNVNRVRLAWEAAYATNYQIQFSTNGTTWTTVREFWGKNSSAADNQTGLTGTARYVKVYCINRATQYGFSLWEFEVYGTSAP